MRISTATRYGGYDKGMGWKQPRRMVLYRWQGWWRVLLDVPWGLKTERTTTTSI